MAEGMLMLKLKECSRCPVCKKIYHLDCHMNYSLIAHPVMGILNVYEVYKDM